MAIAAHGGDHAIYPDCRPEFIDHLRPVLANCDYSPVQLFAPFLHQHKAEIVKVGAVLKTPMDLTWTCYQGRERHCGKCGSCVERREAFAAAGVPDPTEYEN